eukprot:Em0018g853a
MAAVVGNIEQDVDVALARTELNSAVPGSHSLGATELVSFCGETETASLLESTAAASAAEVVREKRLVKLQSSSNLWASGTNEKELKANMYIHLSNPLQRWRTDRILPWKMILQGVKALLVLAQAFLLTASPFDYRVYIMPETQDVFTNLLVNSPNDPISRYTFYAYSIDDVLEELQFSSDQFYYLKNITLAGYDYVKAENGSIIPIQVILTQYNLVELNTSERTFTLGGTYNDVSFWLQPSTQSQKSIVDQFLNASQDPDFARFVKMDVLFQVNHLRVVPPTMVLCYVISIKVGLASSIMHYQAVGGGIVQYSLSANPEYVSCNKRVAVNQSGDISVKLRLLTVLDGAVLIICTVSLISTGVVMFKSYKLAKIASSYDYSSSLIAVKVLLGIGITLQSAVMLRYISYFEQLKFRNLALSLIIHAHQESHVQEESVIDEVNLFIYSGPLTPQWSVPQGNCRGQKVTVVPFCLLGLWTQMLSETGSLIMVTDMELCHDKTPVMVKPCYLPVNLIGLDLMMT